MRPDYLVSSLVFPLTKPFCLLRQET